MGDVCFCNNKLSSVTIPSTVVNIGVCSFNDNKIIEVNGASSDGLIYQRNKDGSRDLSSVVSYGGESDCIDFIPDHVRKIERWAFIFCDLEKVVIPDGVTHIMSRAFYSNQIEELSIAESVMHITGGAFTENKLKMFNGKPSNGFIFARDENGNEDLSQLACYAGVQDKVIVIPDSVEVIKSEAFYGCRATKVVFSKNLKRIEQTAFQSSNLISIDLPDGIKHISYRAFIHSDAKSLTLPSSLVHIGNSAFNGCEVTEINGKPSDGLIHARKEDGTVDYKTIVSYAGGKTNIDFIPDTVETISKFCFLNCRIKKVVLPKSIKSIAQWGFWESWGGTSPHRVPPVILPSKDLDNKPVYWLDSKNEEVSEIRSYSLSYKSYPVPVYYTVKYDSNGGVDGTINSEKVIEGKCVKLAANPTKTGFDLVGWNSNPDCSGLDITKAFTIRADGTVFAKWKPIFDGEFNVVAGVDNEFKQDQYLLGENGGLVAVNSDLNDSRLNLNEKNGLSDTKFTVDRGWNLAHIPENMLELWDDYDFTNNEFWIYIEGDPIAGTAKYEKLENGEIPLPGEGLWIVNTQGKKQEYKIDSNKQLSEICPEVKLVEGWNIIGVEKQLPLEYNETELWEWDATIQDYKSFDSRKKLVPSKGYWIYMTKPGYILEEDASGEFYIITRS